MLIYTYIFEISQSQSSMGSYKKMGQDNSKLSVVKQSSQSAKAEGNHQEEAKWANVIGHILKDRGEYVEALKWLTRLRYLFQILDSEALLRLLLVFAKVLFV